MIFKFLQVDNYIFRILKFIENDNTTFYCLHIYVGNFNNYESRQRNLRVIWQTINRQTVIISDVYKYGKAEKDAVDLLLSTTNIANVYLLQETDNSSQIIESLKNRNFKIIHFEGQNKDNDTDDKDYATNTFIALDPGRFNEIENLSFYSTKENKGIAVATAVDKLTRQKIAFVSAYVSALVSLDHFLSPEKNSGNFCCKEIAEKLSTLNSDLQVIGANMNTNPEISETARARFKIFFEIGFETFITNKATAIDSLFEYKELDFIFVKRAAASTVRYNFYPKEQPLTFDPETNASDHLPVVISVQSQPETTDSKI